MKADEKAQDRTKENEDQEKDANVFVAPVGLRMLQMIPRYGPIRSQRLLPFSSPKSKQARVTLHKDVGTPGPPGRALSEQ
jgi:hypothetical protein